MEQKNIKLILAYDGANYEGWQYQPGRPTIQGTIEERLSKILGEPIRIIASGRTDAGVHALNQVANFKCSTRLETLSIMRGLNSLLPRDILVKSVECVSADFHARYSARSKVYEYRILNRQEPDIFLRAFQWHIRNPLDRSVMADCLEIIRGIHDFSSFRSSGSGNINPVRNLLAAELIEKGDGKLILRFEADGFLRHMVRNIVGTLVEAAQGKLMPERFGEILEGRDRTLAGPNAPPHGLFLVEVKY
ncbi:MAG: tRNA pseudouridine(38-40) synthase TruA [Desulfobacteraceae bacterium]|nr:MAG: tRNA pseudouridine(38-40) synthase TruA [Desulfobacteraceae bacterium]